MHDTRQKPNERLCGTIVEFPHWTPFCFVTKNFFSENSKKKIFLPKKKGEAQEVG